MKAALDELRSKNRTLLDIAHRRSTIQSAGHALGQGKIVEFGTFQKLVANGDLFARMVETQSIDQ